VTWKFTSEPIALGARQKLLLFSLLVQLVDLCVIWLLSCEIKILAYYQHYLMACVFFGLGLGALELKTGKLRIKEKHWTGYLTAILCLLAVCHLTGIGELGTFWDPSTYYLSAHFLTNPLAHELLMMALLFAVFTLTIRCFASLACLAFSGFDRARPGWGLALFFLGSAVAWIFYDLVMRLQWPPALLVAIVFAGYMALCGRSWRRLALALASLAAVMSLELPRLPSALVPAAGQPGRYSRTAWAGGCAVNTYPFLAAGRQWGFAVNVNHDLYEPCVDLAMDSTTAKSLRSAYGDYMQAFPLYYDVPYLAGARAGNVLVLGAGTGVEVASALRHGAGHVDAVDSRAWLLQLGQRNPLSPYSSPRVRRILGDPRSFLRFGRGKYDLIIFATLESPGSFSPFGSLRSDDYFYTSDSFFDAARHLAASGAMVVTSKPMRDWLDMRLARNMKAARLSIDAAVLTPFRHCLISFPSRKGQIEKVLRGVLPKRSLGNARQLAEDCQQLTANPDDWPFTFLIAGSVPRSYLVCMILCLLVMIIQAAPLQKNGPAPPESPETSGPLFDLRSVAMLILGASIMLALNRCMGLFALSFGSQCHVVTWGAGFALGALALAGLIFAGPLKPPVAVAWILVFISLVADFFFNYEAMPLIGQPMLRLLVSALLPVLPAAFLGAVAAPAVERHSSKLASIGFLLIGMAWGLTQDAVALCGGFYLVSEATAILSLCALLLLVVKGRVRVPSVAQDKTPPAAGT